MSVHDNLQIVENFDKILVVDDMVFNITAVKNLL